MNKIILIFTFIILGIAPISAQNNYIFFDGTYEQLQERADNAKRPYFLYFYANWCMPAKEMNEKTFSNQYFIKYADAKYLGMAIDGESLITEGSELAKTYQVLYYPTIIIFSPYGKELKRLYGYQSPATLIKEMQKYENSEAEPSEKDIEALEFEAHTPKQGEYLFNLSAKKQPQEGYGVQLGVYGTYRNAFVRILELEEKHNIGKILVHVQEKADGTSIFRVILGPFREESQARDYVKMLKAKQNIAGVFVDLKALK